MPDIAAYRERLDIMVGRSISHYSILARLGRGGMGEVYKAEDTRLGRTVALKFLPGELSADQAAKERFILEARTASALDHPNICTIHEIGEDDGGRLFIAMSCYQGETLKQRIARGALTVREIEEIGTQIALGMSKAHEKGIIHRDLNPSNVMITEDGVVKILDFGLATLIHEQAADDIPGRSGTIPYMAPEQLQEGATSTKSDIWSFGVLLYEMLARTLPFRGAYVPALIYSITHEEPVPVRSERTDIPERLEQLCYRCLRRDPAERPASMSEIVEVLQPETLTPAPAPGVQRPARTRVRWIAGIAAVLLLAAAGWFIWREVVSVPAGEGQIRIAVLPFDNYTRDSTFADWPVLLQILMANELIGFEGLRIVDPMSVNASLGQDVPGSGRPDLSRTVTSWDLDVSFLVQGGIQRSADGFTIQCMIVDIGTKEIKHAFTRRIKDQADIQHLSVELSDEVRSYFQVEQYDPERLSDLHPWLSTRTKNLSAVRAFLRASELKFRMVPGGQKYLREAIALDSAFITPRTWLISDLVNAGKNAEARMHQAVLKRLELSASPFEQALIQWTQGLIDRDYQAQARALESAREYSPGNTVILFLLGEIRYWLDDFRGALEALQPTILMKWPFQPAHALAGECYFRLGMRDSARLVLVQSLRYEPVFPDTYLTIAALDLKDDSSANAEKNCARYREEMTRRGAPEELVTLSMVDWFIEYGFTDFTERICVPALARNPVSAPLLARKGRILFLRGKLDSARMVFEKALRIDPATPDAIAGMGRIAQARNDLPEAVRHFRHFLRIDSTSIEAHRIHRIIEALSTSPSITFQEKQ